MKRILLITVLCLACVVTGVWAQSKPSVQALDAKNGFLDATFGMAASEITGLKLVSSVGPKQVYERLSKKPTLGGYKLERIHYTFYQDQLCSIMLAVAGKANNEGVLRTLQQSYGAGAAEGRTHTWNGNRVNMVFGQLGQDNGVVTLTSKPLLAQMQKEAAKGNSGRGSL